MVYLYYNQYKIKMITKIATHSIFKTEGRKFMDNEKILSVFREKKLRATPQRIAVYRFLCENRVHPSAGEVYDAVRQDNPSFSRTTVYNALSSLIGSGLVVPLLADESRVRYDADTSFHGHFFCTKCKRVYDFHAGEQDFADLAGFEIQMKDLSCSGICAACRQK